MEKNTNEKQIVNQSATAKEPAHPLEALNETGNKLSKIAQKTFWQTSKAAIATAVDVGDSLGNTVFVTGRTIARTTAELGSVIGTVSGTTVEASNAIAEMAAAMGQSATEQIYQWIEITTQGAGKAVTSVSDNRVVRTVSKPLKLDWLTGIVSQTDIEKAAAKVESLQRKYPNESPSQIAHRIMVQKAVQVGGMGFASSVLPGLATALLAVDLAATTALQTEMVYQIAAAYGMDLQDPTRKGEVLGIFGLATGGKQAIKAGLGFLRNIPVAGAMIGASTNATMIYSVGYAACRFYEAKLREATSEPSPQTLDALKAETDQYLEIAISQQALMDQILVHMILASYPDKTWEDILPELRELNLTDASQAAIAADLDSPKPLGALLDQLNPDFAVPILAECDRIARLDQHITEAEQTILEAIASRFEIDLEAIAADI